MHLAQPPTRDASRPSASGPVLFARYAYGPNRLGLCGPDDDEALFGQTSSNGDDRELRDLARGFEGAYPYLELIARANAIADPLDRRVVEAYWLGSPLLERVSPNSMGESLRLRFRPKLGQRTWKWLESSAPSGAKPVHAFHVLDVFPKVGLMRSEQVENVLRVMDSCRVRWGRVIQRDGDQLLVNAVPLAFADGELVLGPSRTERSRPGATVTALSARSHPTTSSRSTGTGPVTFSTLTRWVGSSRGPGASLKSPTRHCDAAMQP